MRCKLLNYSFGLENILPLMGYNHTPNAIKPLKTLKKSYSIMNETLSNKTYHEISLSNVEKQTEVYGWYL